MSTPYKLEFVATFSGEQEAGLMPFSEVITLTLESGDPGEAGNDFAENFQKFLAEWYDGATVVPKSVFDENMRLENKMFEERDV